MPQTITQKKVFKKTREWNKIWIFNKWVKLKHLDNFYNNNDVDCPKIILFCILHFTYPSKKG